MRTRLTFPSLFAQCGLLAVVLVAYHFLLSHLMLHYDLRLGAISYKLAPLYAYWRPHLKGWLLVPLVVLAVYFWWLRRTRLATSLTDRAAAAAFTVWFILIATSVAMLDGGPQSLVRPLVERADIEYYGAIDRVHNVREFFRDYPQLASTMPMHAQVHPPGAVVLLWALTKLLGGGPWAAAVGIIGFSSLSVLVVYRWANRLGGPGVARRAAALCTLTPSLVLFTATSMDGPFAVFLIATMWLFWEALEQRPLLLGTLAGVTAALAALVTYSVAVAVLFCGIAACITWLTRPERRLATIGAAAAACAGFVGLHGVLWAATGYDPIEMFRVAVTNDSRIMSGAHHESLARYVHLAVGNLVTFFIAAGLPSAVIWWPAAYRAVREQVRRLTNGGRSVGNSLCAVPAQAPHYATTHPRNAAEGVPYRTAGHVPARSIHNFLFTACMTLLVTAAVPVYVLEVERVWMFLVPLVAIPVAGQLFDQERGTGKIHGSLAVAALLAVQTLLTEVLLTTYW